VRAVKGNKEYTIDETQKKSYQDSGFDILDDDGNVVAYGRGKTVPYEEHMKAVNEIGRLQALCAERHAENETLKAELESIGATAQEQKKKVESKKAGE